ncbi:hypothetical protein VP01_7586g1, partial [Puccinia sorghi]
MLPAYKGKEYYLTIRISISINILHTCVKKKSPSLSARNPNVRKSHSFSGLINLGKKSLLLSILSGFNHGSFSQITIKMSQPTSHFSNSLSESQLQNGYEEASKIGITGIAAKVAKDPDGYCKLQSHVPEQNTFILKQFYLVSGPLFYEVKKQHNALGAPGLEPKKQHNALGAPGLEPNFKEDPDVFTCHLSFTISNFSKKPHKDYNSSPFTFVMWIPIKQTTGNFVEENFEVKGGEFVFPYDSCGINFLGFNGII